MQVTYSTLVIGEGNHASMVIPDEVLAQLGASRRAPLKITVNGHTYRSTATGVSGQWRVVFPMRDREAAGVAAGDIVTVKLELEVGYREVEIPTQLASALIDAGLAAKFRALSYSKRREFARLVGVAKSSETAERRVLKVLDTISAL